MIHVNVYKIKCSKNPTFRPKRQPSSGESDKNFTKSKMNIKENASFELIIISLVL